MGSTCYQVCPYLMVESEKRIQVRFFKEYFQRFKITKGWKANNPMHYVSLLSILVYVFPSKPL